MPTPKKHRPYYLTGDEPPGTLIGVRHHNFTAGMVGRKGANGEYPLSRLLDVNVTWKDKLHVLLEVPNPRVPDEWDVVYKLKTSYISKCYKILDAILYNKELAAWREDVAKKDVGLREATIRSRKRVVQHFMDCESAFAEEAPAKKARKKRQVSSAKRAQTVR